MLYIMMILYMIMFVFVLHVSTRKTETLGPYLVPSPQLLKICSDLVRRNHIGAAVIIMAISFSVTSGLSYIYAFIPCGLVGWIIGGRWARLRMTRMHTIQAEQNELLTRIASHFNEASSFPSDVQAIKVSIPPLPLLIDSSVLIISVAVGVLLGFGTSEVVRHI